MPLSATLVQIMTNKLTKARSTFFNITYLMAGLFCFRLNYNAWDSNICENDQNAIKK